MVIQAIEPDPFYVYNDLMCDSLLPKKADLVVDFGEDKQTERDHVKNFILSQSVHNFIWSFRNQW